MDSNETKDSPVKTTSDNSSEADAGSSVDKPRKINGGPDENIVSTTMTTSESLQDVIDSLVIETMKSIGVEEGSTDKDKNEREKSVSPAVDGTEDGLDDDDDMKDFHLTLSPNNMECAEDSDISDSEGSKNINGSPKSDTLIIEAVSSLCEDDASANLETNDLDADMPGSSTQCTPLIVAVSGTSKEDETDSLETQAKDADMPGSPIADLPLIVAVHGSVGEDAIAAIESGDEITDVAGICVQTAGGEDFENAIEDHSSFNDIGINENMTVAPEPVMMSPDHQSNVDDDSAIVVDELGLLAETKTKPPSDDDENGSSEGIDDDDEDDDDDDMDDDAADSATSSGQHDDEVTDQEVDEAPHYEGADLGGDKTDDFNITISAVSGNFLATEESTSGPENFLMDEDSTQQASEAFLANDIASTKADFLANEDTSAMDTFLANKDATSTSENFLVNEDNASAMETITTDDTISEKENSSATGDITSVVQNIVVSEDSTLAADKTKDSLGEDSNIGTDSTGTEVTKKRDINSEDESQNNMEVEMLDTGLVSGPTTMQDILQDTHLAAIADDLNLDLADIAMVDPNVGKALSKVIMESITTEDTKLGLGSLMRDLADDSEKVETMDDAETGTEKTTAQEDESSSRISDASQKDASEKDTSEKDSSDKGSSEKDTSEDDESSSDKDADTAGNDFQLGLETESSEKESDEDEEQKRKDEEKEAEMKERKRQAELLIQRMKEKELQKAKEEEEKRNLNNAIIDKQLKELDKFISEKLKKSFTEKESSPKMDETVVVPSPVTSVGDDAAETTSATPPSKILPEDPKEATPALAVAEPIETDAVLPVQDKETDLVHTEPINDNAPLASKVLVAVNDRESSPEIKIMDINEQRKQKIENNPCVNASCVTPMGAEWFACPIFVLSYFKVKRTKKISQYVCDTCFNEVVAHYERIAQCLPSGKKISAVDRKVKHVEFVEISDSESDSDGEDDYTGNKGEPLSEHNKKMLSDDFFNSVNNMWKKYRMNDQIQYYKQDLRVAMETYEKSTADLNTLFSGLQIMLDKIASNLYQTFKPDSIEQGQILIDSTEAGESNTDIRLCLVENNFNLHMAMNRQNQQNQQNQQTWTPNQRQVATQSQITNQPQDLTSADDAEVSVVRQDKEHAPKDLPPPGELPLQIPQVDDIVFAVKKSAFGAWGCATVLEVWPKGSTPSVFTIFRVRFESKNKDKPNQIIKSLTGRQIALAKLVPVRLDVGTRVIAMFKDQDDIYKEDTYYSGVIAEPPKPVNGFRYLVFFDDGYAQYAEHSRILVVCEHSPRVWEDVHPDSRDFVRKYLQAYPERPMVRLQRGQQLKTEWNGSWWWCTVVNVDASLAKISFPEGRFEWVYRGSTRLAPLYRELATLPGPQAPTIVSTEVVDVTTDTQPTASAPPLAPIHQRSHATSRRSLAARGGLNVPYVEYTNADKDVEPEESEANKLRRHADAGGVTAAPKKQAVAKKSVTNVTPHRPPPRVVATPNKADSQGEPFTSKVVYYAPKNYIRPHKLVPHRCSFKCQRSDTLPLKSIRNYNPLAKPILAGWERLFVKFLSRKVVMYRAPCGRRLRNMEELHRYLRVTESEMAVDLFSFDKNIHCLGEFVLNQWYASKKDVTQGLEQLPIPCVNYYDDRLPEFCQYSTTRIPTKGVDLNLNSEFLCGCDCTDDCQDKEKCQCWQLTYQGARFMGIKDLNSVGYQYKRLPESVNTGIYECNSRCKCAKTCLNRVVQHPLQLKLQVFKTYNRGWGIRALNDLPKGTFISVYAGNLLTDATANEDGLIDGDEYLAELDYIEVVENLKMDYEADIPFEDKVLDKRSNCSVAKKHTRGHRSQSPDGESGDESDKSNGDNSNKSYELDREFRPDYSIKTTGRDISTRLRARSDKDKSGSKDSDKEAEKDQTVPELETENDFITISDDEEAREPSRFAAPDGLADREISKYKSVRTLFGEEEACFIMDAKVRGNIGRYLNHSCSPNVFVQNVFVDTHDPRFPWVAFFSLCNIRAGTELTWDYNYDVGSVRGKVILCKCGASNCRGRLL